MAPPKPVPAPIPAGLDKMVYFPVVIPTKDIVTNEAFKPLELVKRAGKVCVCQDAKDGYKPKWGGGFHALRGTTYHQALDIMAPVGALVIAIDEGVVMDDVVIIRKGKDGKPERVRTPGVAFTPIGGHNVWIKHSWGTSYYAHMHEVPKVKPGQNILPGDLVGRVGTSGNATGGCPHLHIAIEYANKKADPQALLKFAYEREEWRDEKHFARWKSDPRMLLAKEMDQ